MVNLEVGWIDHKAVRYACKAWHYSRTVPVGKMVKVGVWEDGKFIGVIVFSRGANKSIGKPYGLEQTECCELTRIALREHKSFVSEMMAKAITLLKQKVTGLRLIVSYSDIDQRHHGGIYQATNWIYTGETGKDRYFMVEGRVRHPKSLHTMYGTGTQQVEWLREHIDKRADIINVSGKHKYLMPLDKKMRRQIKHLAKPYPEKITKGVSMGGEATDEEETRAQETRAEGAEDSGPAGHRQQVP